MANLSRLFRSHKFFFVIFGIVLFTRIVVSGILGYEYINFSSTKEVKKGGTFIEGIYEPISYLPYWGDHQKNQFYQTLLFPGCEGGLEDPLCHVSTTDNKTYTISISTGLQWSDGESFTLDDIIFSYQDVVISNLWDQPYLSQYHDIFMSEDESNSGNIIVTFPTASEQNRNFFQLPIIPYHIIQSLDLEGYVKSFAAKPIVLSCASLAASKDTDSLVFDLSNCPNTDINYYQIKTFDSLDSLEQHINGNKNIVSFYYGNTNTSAYKLLPIEDNYFMTMFFNTKSTKLSPRIQRSIAGFIDYNFWQQEHTGYLSTYSGLLDYHQTTGENLSAYIKEKNPYLSYDKALLEQGGVKALPPLFTIDWAKRKSAFYLNATDKKEYSFTIETNDPVFDIKAKTNKSLRYLITKSESNNKKHTITFSIGEDQQIEEGLNSITIGGTILGIKQEVANIDIYYLGQTSKTNTINKIKIITLDNTLSNYVRLKIQTLLEQHQIQDLFEFVIYDNKDEFLNAIMTKNYDMVLSTIKMTSLADVHTILNSQDPQINPSLYYNPVLNQFAAENKRTDTRNIFSTEMPFFIIGQMVKPYRINNNIVLQYTGTYSDIKVRDLILKNVSMVSRNQIKGSDMINPTNIINFIHQYR